MIILFVFAVFLILILFNQKKNYLFFIPFILQLADISKVFIEGGPASRGAILLDYTVILTSITFCLVIIFQNMPVIRKNAAGVFLFLIYLFLVLFLSTDVWWSFKRFLNVSLSILVLPTAFILVKDTAELKRIIKPVIWLIIIFLINVAICTFLGLEFEEKRSEYGRTFVYLGSVNFFSVYGFVYALIMVPLIYYLTNRMSTKYLLIVLYFIGLFVLFLLLKRTYVYLAVAGVGLFILFMSKRKSLRFLAPFLIVGIVIYMFLGDYILTSIRIRQDVLRRGYIEEGRGIELLLYPQVVKFAKEPNNFLLFGEELFNSQGKFVIIEKALNDKDRLLHSDLATILYGAGVFGLLLFFRMYILIIRKYLIFKNRLRRIYLEDSFNKIFASFISVYFCLMINTFSDGMMVATNRVLPYLLMGAILGIMYNKIKQPIVNPQSL